MVAKHTFVDYRDIQILSILINNSRVSAREIARRLGLSAGTVQARIKRLEELGIIEGYTIKLNLEKLGYIFPVLIDIKVSKGKIRQVEHELSKYDNVYAVYDITGDYDITIFALFKSRWELDDFIKEINEHRYIERTHTRLILNVITQAKVKGFLKRPEETI